MLQPGQLTSMPVSGLFWGLLLALPYTRILGVSQALAAGAAMGLLLCLMAGWLVYRSDFGARHFVVNSVFFVLAAAPFLAGASMALADMVGAVGWMPLAWAIGFVSAAAPTLVVAWQVHRRLAADGESGPWARAHLDLREGALLPGALSASEAPRQAMTPWQIGALAVNVPLVWRSMGGGQTSLLAMAVVAMSCALAWAGVKQVGPVFGAAWFVLGIERRTGRQLVHPDYAAVQAMRRGHWLARRFMRDG